MADMSKVSAGSRSRWVGPPVAPQNERGKSPIGRQRHYGAVELPGVGQQVYVNDVVEVLPKHNSGYSKKKKEQRPRLGQVLSMWEDTFTGVFKFRARWLIHASDLPQDALSRLHAARRAFTNDSRSSEGDAKSSDAVEDNEVFLTPRMDDLEVRFILRPVTMSVIPGPKTEIPAELEGKMGPRFTHTYDDSTGDVVPVEETDSILKRARVRQSEAIAFASRANEEHQAAKKGEPVKSNGWLLPKRRVFDRKGRGDISGYASGHEVDSGSSSPDSPARVSSPISEVDMEVSNDSEPEEVPNPNDEEWKEGDDGDGDTTDTDDDLDGSSKHNDMPKKDFTPRKSTRQRKTQQPLDLDAEVTSDSSVIKLSSSSQRRSRALATKDAGTLPPRPRRLDMPPVTKTEEPVLVPDGEGDAHNANDNCVETKQVRSVGTRMTIGPRVKNSLALPRSSSAGSLVNVAMQSPVTGKRRRNSTTKETEEDESESDYPPRHTPVGKEFQTDIPDLLSDEDRKRQATGTGARMVWRSIRDWDPHSRGMLAEYLHTAREVVQSKQARPGVAVHVRLGGSYSGVDRDDHHIDNMDCAGSYAVWALTAGRDACGVVRVACSEMAQTEVPRSAVQRVQCEEEALAALIKTMCILDDFEPALDLLAQTSSGPQSLELWTLAQVRTLEKALEDEFDPKRRLHGWARPGMSMDREDFIDLAKVSKQVPGKTPAQVLAFYYRYLAAAEPLTDVVYGPKAAEARRQEDVPFDREADKSHFWGAHLPRGSSDPARIGIGITQALDISRGENRAADCNSVGNTSGNGSEGGMHDPELNSEPRVIPQPKPPQEPIMTKSKSEDEKPKDTEVGQTGTQPIFRPYTAEPHRIGVSISPRRDGTSREVTSVVPGGGGRPTETSGIDSNYSNQEDARKDQNESRPATKATSNEHIDRDADDGRPRHGMSEQRTRAEDNSSGRFKSLPPDAEVFEVHDSDDEMRSQARKDASRRTPPPAPVSKRASLPKSVVEAAAKHLSTLGPQGLKWLGRQIRAPSGPVPARDSLPSPAYPVPPHSAASTGGGMERPRTGHAAYTPYAVQVRDAGLTEGQRHAIWDRRQAPLSLVHDPPGRRSEGRASQGVGSGSASELGAASRGSNVPQAPDEALTDDMFGAMAPCWRLLERAKAYMDKDQLVYMRGLILTHVKKPMSREQLLERAESCLHEQDKIFAAFAKMFDLIDQSPSVPLYPAKNRQAVPGYAPRHVISYSPKYAPTAPVGHAGNPGSSHRPASNKFRVEAGDRNAFLPSNASGGAAGGSRSPPERALPYGPTHSAAAMPRSSWWAPRHGGDTGGESGAVGFVKYSPRRGSPTLPISAGSGRGVLHPEGNGREYTAYDVGVASRNSWSQQPLHQLAHRASRQPSHQSPQWRMDSNNPSMAAAAAAAEAAKRGEARRGSTWGSNSSARR